MEPNSRDKAASIEEAVVAGFDLPGRPLKVALASMAPFVGGAEVAAERLAVGLQQAGHDVVVLLGQAGAVLERMQASGLRCIVTPMCFTDRWHWLRYVRARHQLRRLLRQERPDVVHSNDLTTHQLVSDAARGLGVPRLCHQRYGYEPAFVAWLSKFGAEHYLYVSQALMDAMTAASPQLAAASRAVVYDGLPLEPAPNREDCLQARQALGLPTDKVIVIFAGQIIERKGVQDLLHAWARLPPELQAAAELIIVGDDLDGRGAYRLRMEQLAGELRVPARFVGFQKNVGVWLKAADIATVPSHVEPLGNATLEAMAAALPVIGGKVGGIPEMVVHEETGLLVPPRDPERLAQALTRVLLNAEERRRFGRQGRQRCEERFSLPAHVQAVLHEYRRVLAGQPLPAV